MLYDFFYYTVYTQNEIEKKKNYDQKKMKKKKYSKNLPNLTDET